MKTIVLIHPKINYQDNYPCSWIPFSILSIGSAIPRDKFDVCLFDENITDREEIFRALSCRDIVLVGISIMTGGGQIQNALEIAQRVRSEHPETKIVFGGPHANVLPEQTIACSIIDYVICGMGQHAFTALAECINEKKVPEQIPGLYYKSNAGVVHPQISKAHVQHLLPYDFSLIDPEPYIKYDATISDRTLNYIASQGCPYGCSFCYESTYGRKYYRMRSEFVRQDISLYAESFRVDGIKFYDADFFVNKEACDEIIHQLRKYDLKWAASIHPNDILRNQTGISNGLLDSISKSNCTRLLMGMESGSNRILKKVINKNTRAEDYIHIAKAISDYGILGSYTFMVGFPGETEKEIDETFELVRRLWELHVPIETKIHIYLPYPGTPLYRESIASGFQPPNQLVDWSNYNYYKSMTPWTNSSLEDRLSAYTRMIDKTKRGNK